MEGLSKISDTINGVDYYFIKRIRQLFNADSAERCTCDCLAGDYGDNYCKTY